MSDPTRPSLWLRNAGRRAVRPAGGGVGDGPVVAVRLAPDETVILLPSTFRRCLNGDVERESVAKSQSRQRLGPTSTTGRSGGRGRWRWMAAAPAVGENAILPQPSLSLQHVFQWGWRGGVSRVTVWPMATGGAVINQGIHSIDAVLWLAQVSRGTKEMIHTLSVPPLHAISFTPPHHPLPSIPQQHWTLGAA